MPTLNVPNAILNYETTGSGPTLLCLPGANGEHFIFQGLARALADTFTVVTYDRRGFSQSLLTGPQDYTRRLQTDADDAAALIAVLSPSQPAFVFGSSSGAIVALQLLLSHPGSVRTLVAHEPPTLHELPDSRELIDHHVSVYQLYRQQGLVAAQQHFAARLGAVDRAAMSQSGGSRGPFGQANATYWFERELPVYPLTQFDVTALEQVKDKLIMGAGTESDHSFAYQAALIWSEKLGVPIAHLTGGHVGYAMYPTEFAQDLRTTLAEHRPHSKTLKEQH